MESILAAGPDLNADCEDVEDMNNSAMETPRLSLSKAPSLNNMLDDGKCDSKHLLILVSYTTTED